MIQTKKFITKILLTISLTIVFSTALNRSTMANPEPNMLTAKELTEYFKTKEAIQMVSELRDSICAYDSLVQKSINSWLKTEAKQKWMHDLVAVSLSNNMQTLPSIMLAQAALETEYGRRAIGNNIFGIKGKGHSKILTKEFLNGRLVSKRLNFQSFASLSKAVSRYDRIILRYELSGTDYVQWARKIQASGYATSPVYAKRLIFIIEKCNLQYVDKIKVMTSELVCYEQHLASIGL